MVQLNAMRTRREWSCRPLRVHKHTWLLSSWLPGWMARNRWWLNQIFVFSRDFVRYCCCDRSRTGSRLSAFRGGTSCWLCGSPAEEASSMAFIRRACWSDERLNWMRMWGPTGERWWREHLSPQDGQREDPPWFMVCSDHIAVEHFLNAAESRKTIWGNNAKLQIFQILFWILPFKMFWEPPWFWLYCVLYVVSTSLEILKRAPCLKVILLLLYLLGMSDVIGLLLLLAVKGIKN